MIGQTLPSLFILLRTLLSAPSRSQLPAGVGLVIHAAARVDLRASYAALRAANVLGTLAVPPAPRNLRSLDMEGGRQIRSANLSLFICFIVLFSGAMLADLLQQVSRPQRQHRLKHVFMSKVAPRAWPLSTDLTCG